MWWSGRTSRGPTLLVLFLPRQQAEVFCLGYVIFPFNPSGGTAASVGSSATDTAPQRTWSGPAAGTQSCWELPPESEPVCTALAHSWASERNQMHYYWPFATSNLFNWRTQNSPFSEKPSRFNESLGDSPLHPFGMISNSSYRFSSAQTEARKLVPGPMGELIKRLSMLAFP